MLGPAVQLQSCKMCLQLQPTSIAGPSSNRVNSQKRTISGHTSPAPRHPANPGPDRPAGQFGRLEHTIKQVPASPPRTGEGCAKHWPVFTLERCPVRKDLCSNGVAQPRQHRVDPWVSDQVIPAGDHRQGRGSGSWPLQVRDTRNRPFRSAQPCMPNARTTALGGVCSDADTSKRLPSQSIICPGLIETAGRPAPEPSR